MTTQRVLPMVLLMLCKVRLEIVICLTANLIANIFTFCWPCCISVYLSQYLTKLMHKICFTTSFISCLYMFRAHVLIIRRSTLHYTASGIITPIGGRLVHGLREDCRAATCAPDGHLQVWWHQRLCNAILTSWWSAHVLETCRGMK